MVLPIKLAHSSFSSSMHSLLPKDNLFKNVRVGGVFRFQERFWGYLNSNNTYCILFR